ncbi:MAG: hypothetical protein LBR26_03360, partial [Prevotella sp.]|nr:hypothetical protein [Prevotella sp.]
MNVNYFFRLAIAFSAMAGLVACDTDSDEPEDDGKAVIKHTQDKDTLYVDYNGTLDLSTVFTLEQSAKGVAKLAYKVERQPDYAEGNSEEFTTVDAYGISGSVLSAIPGVRVPDAVNKEDRVRVVREGKLKVSVEGAKEEVEPLVFTIVMKDKPALVPVITLSEGLAEKLTGGKLVLENVGQYHLFTANSFTISP